MSKPITRITLQAPATTANMGPGFDCMGMALDIFNTISVELADSLQISISGQGAGELSRGPDNMVYRGFEAVFREQGLRPPTVRLTCHNNIPLARGLGSSASAIAGGMVAANIMSDDALPLEELLRLADGIEGHPDNVAPALFGGCQIVLREGDRLIPTPCPVSPDLSMVLLIPDLKISTEKARAVLPKTISMGEAIFNVGRAALLSMALATGNTDALRRATQDALHQPYRASLFPGMEGIFRAALDAGAYGVFLSGSGSTILALAGGKQEAIASAMLGEARRQGLAGVTRVAHPCLSGVSVRETVFAES